MMGDWRGIRLLSTVSVLGLFTQGNRVRGQGIDVPCAVDINPHNDLVDKLEDALGLSELFGGENDTPIVDRWYFWLIIALIAIFVIVCGYFTIRGFRRYRRVMKENQLRMLIPETQEVVYFDAETQEYIVEMSRRTGIPAEKIKVAAARHAVQGMGLKKKDGTVKVDDAIVDEVSQEELYERYENGSVTERNETLKVSDEET